MRQHFSLDPELIYLNSGTHSICPTAVLQAVARYQQEYERNPTLGLNTMAGRLWKVQCELAEFFQANPGDLFLRANVTEAMNAFLLGMPLPAHSEILMSNLEYGAIVNLCRFRAEQDGLTVRRFDLPVTSEDLSTYTADRLVGDIVGALRPETRVLVLSHVMTANGFTLPLKRIAAETRRRNVLLVVDGAHGPGFSALNFKELEDVDFYGGNLHKWMMGFKGTGFGWVPERHQTVLRTLMAGWSTFESPEHLRAFGGQSRFAARMLMAGCHDYAPFLSLHETLQFWNSQGCTVIVNRIRELQTYLEVQIRNRLGWRCLSPAAGDLRGPLLSFEIPDSILKMYPALMAELLERYRLQISTPLLAGHPCIRLSPHIYNTRDEIDRAVSVLEKLES